MSNCLSIYVPHRLKYVKKIEDNLIFHEILDPIIKVEIDFGQPSSLAQETKDEVVNLAIRSLPCDARFAEKAKSISEKQKRMSEDPRLISKQLLSLLLVLLKSNVEPNFIRNDTNLAKYLAEKVKPVFIEKLRANSIKIVFKSRWTILMKHAMEGLKVSESPFFAKEELEEIIGFLHTWRFI
uniref:Uncharacterized protein n=1 Tax=Romanomermis culicivorax TaxID=13658 RepID=A0A915KZ45_ROMCU